MKKNIKRILLILIVFVMVFEFSFSSTVNAASDTFIDEETLNMISNLAGGIISIVLWIPRLLITGFSFVINLLVQGIAESEGIIPDSTSYTSNTYITPFQIFFNEYEILGINFFDVQGFGSDTFIYKFRTTVAFWFYALRMISTVILLCMLIYVGIKMAIASVADDRAKYKKMFFDWACSLALIFVLHYLAIGIIYLNNGIVEALASITQPEALDDMMNELALSATLGVGINSLVSVFVYCAIIAQTIFFFIAYVNRMLKTGFLIIISPLISITYSIDKMGDGKAQALNNWLKEFTYTILIQPFHCIMYIALISTAFALVTGASNITTSGLPALLQTAEYNKLANGVLAILCLKFVSDGEKVVRKIFGFSDDNSKTSMAAGAVAGMMLLRNAKNMGGTARKGINTIKNRTRGFSQAVSADASKFKGTKVGQALSNKFQGSKLQTAVNSGKNAANTAKRGFSNFAKNNKAMKKINGVKKGVDNLSKKYKGTGLQKAVGKAKEQVKKNIPRALGAMGMMMAYSTGDTSLLESNALRTGITDGATEYFNSSTKTQADFEKNNIQDLEDADYEELTDELEEAKDKVDNLGFGSNIDAEKAGEISKSDAAQNADAKASKAEEAASKQQEEYERATKITEAEKEKLAKAEEEKANAKTHRERANAQKKIDSLNESVRKKEERENQLAEATEKKQLEAERLREDADRYKQISSAVAKRDLLQRQQDNFFSEEATKIRLAGRASGPSKSDLEKKKNQILQLIMKLEQQRSRGQEGDSTHNNVIITEADSDNAMNITENILKQVDASVLKGGASIQASEFLKDRAGLNSRSAETLDSIDKAVKEYERISKAQRVAETFSRHASYNGDSDDLVNAMYKNLKGASRG